MALDPRTPVLIGGGQLSHRVDQGAEPLEPVDLLAEAARLAAADTGAADPGKVLAAVQRVAVPSVFSWRYRDPGRLVAQRLGIDGARTTYTAAGGNTPQALVNAAARAILAGDEELVLMGGAEAWRTRTAAKKSGGAGPAWTVEDESAEPDEFFGGAFDITTVFHPNELARGVLIPSTYYAIFESALRAAAGATHEEWAAHLGALWSRFSAVAATNPHAWIQEALTPEAITTVGPDNRMIGFPYPKLLNSNDAVEQGAAVLVASVEAAERLGVPRDRWVFLHSGTDAHDTMFVINRQDLRSSPAMAVAGNRALELAGVGADDLAHVDLYSCFPSAVQIAAASLGLSLDRQLTETGGLTFAGGPWNNYVSHSIATMVRVLREDPGTVGLVTANGGHTTKHAFGVYSTEPPAAGFRWEAPDAEVEAATSPREAAPADYAGPVTVEAYTVMHGRDGAPERGVAAVLTPAGERHWGATTDAAVMADMETREYVGLAATLAADGDLTFD